MFIKADKIKNYVAFTIVGFVCANCTTTNELHVDKDKKQVHLYSNDDKFSSSQKVNKNKKIATTLTKLRKKVKKSKKSVTDQLNLAQLYLVRNDLKRAEKTIQKILRFDLENPNAKLISAKIYMRRNMEDMAEIILTSLGGAKSKNSEILNMLAMISIRKNENRKAMTLFSIALKFNPNDVAVHMNLGVLHLKFHRLQDAARHFERVLLVVPEHRDAKTHLAAIQTNRGKYDDAEDLLAQVLDKDAKNPVALYNYAALQMKQQEYSDAIENLKKFVLKSKKRKDSKKKALALIEKLKIEIEANGDPISDEEIRELAEELGASDSAKSTADLD